MDEQSPATIDTVSDGSNILTQGPKLSQPGDVGVGDGWDGGYIEATW